MLSMHQQNMTPTPICQQRNAEQCDGTVCKRDPTRVGDPEKESKKR
jgi:hypothetical protein